ncbi:MULTISPECIES: hypothetical protein [unclassified Micromonospora]|uniref:hypothetical protein n=1 Tax=unclassified Micromonospora TaxID=2617518 RepID=UPI0022C8F4FE|nr:hypothetical protein [Micromonospora sp. AKA38]GHJ14048.1 hypothetical protein TPA0908_20430 [Micromonospora sp. AKA38]
MRFRIRTVGAFLAVAAASTLVASGVVRNSASADGRTFSFTMVRSQGAEAAGCLPNARAEVRVHPEGLNEIMTIRAAGLPPRTNFDLFVLQLPDAPFGVSWYQSDMRTSQYGVARVTVVGRFNIETFALAPGAGPAPNTHPGRDATLNPAFGPIHTYHLGLWFNSPQEAVAAGCPGATTPFNGDHTAGVQAMSTRNYPSLAGPLSQVGS